MTHRNGPIRKDHQTKEPKRMKNQTHISAAIVLLLGFLVLYPKAQAVVPAPDSSLGPPPRSNPAWRSATEELASRPVG